MSLMASTKQSSLEKGQGLLMTLLLRHTGISSDSRNSSNWRPNLQMSGAIGDTSHANQYHVFQGSMDKLAYNVDPKDK